MSFNQESLASSDSPIAAGSWLVGVSPHFKSKGALPELER